MWTLNQPYGPDSCTLNMLPRAFWARQNTGPERNLHLNPVSTLHVRSTKHSPSPRPIKLTLMPRAFWAKQSTGPGRNLYLNPVSTLHVRSTKHRPARSTLNRFLLVFLACLALPRSGLLACLVACLLVCLPCCLLACIAPSRLLSWPATLWVWVWVWVWVWGQQKGWTLHWTEKCPNSSISQKEFMVFRHTQILWHLRWSGWSNTRPKLRPIN